MINEENLQSDPLGLQSIYHRLLNILNVELKQLLDITLHPERYLRITFDRAHNLHIYIFINTLIIVSVLQNVCERI